MRSIQGVSTTTAGFLGITEKGPTTPELVTNFTEFQNKFGDYISQSYLPYAVNGFFTNGGKRCFIRRTIELSDYQSGLNDFRGLNEISVVHVPNADTEIVKALISHCESLKDRFAIIDSEQGKSSNSLKPRDQYGSTRFAGFYYPWLKITDPLSGKSKLVPPGGYIAGIFARVDNQKGVHKAPANEVVQLAVDLEFQINQNDQDLLTTQNVNVIRNFPVKGILVWGARTLSQENDWKYVNVRRLLIYIEQSIVRGTQWVVSEPNDEPLWAEVRSVITDFLMQCWRSGALLGRTPKEAFFVKCDRTTMTQDDIDNGRLICLIGVAPIKPAEFVLFRIGQWIGGNDIDE
jgi:phage tail sheath protein FI